MHLQAVDDNKIFPTTYTISSANTWEYKTIAIPPCTIATIDNDTGEGLRLTFITISGSTYTGGSTGSWQSYASNLFAAGHQANVSSDGDTWLITGVQLEIGEKATEFEHEPYEATLRKCHRYFVKINDDFTGTNAYHAWSSIRWGTNQQFATIALPQPIRAQATVSITGTTGVTFKCDGSGDGKTSVVHLNTEKSGHVSFYGNSLSYDPANSKAGTMFINDDSTMQFDAEL